MFPETASVAESGYPGFRSLGFYGVVAPVGISTAVAGRLQKDLAQVLALPDVRERLSVLGVDAPTADTGDFRPFLLEETKVWEKVIRAAKVRIDS